VSVAKPTAGREHPATSREALCGGSKPLDEPSPSYACNSTPRGRALRRKTRAETSRQGKIGLRACRDFDEKEL
jgi:hypothetical protein